MTRSERKRYRRNPNDGVKFAGQLRRDRGGLLATTALQAGAIMLLAFPAHMRSAQAQPAPTARPQGGSVVAGQASIGQTTAQTTVNQSSQRAAIDWRSYDVGSGHTVTYNQPNATSLTVNRVTGPDPSQIAGRIQANGQIAIVNGSGVVFYQGSQVDVQSLVVSSANVSNANVMAGKLVFDQPGRADARISNAGTITVKATGLAALVAPQVQNSGTITAKLGHVVLAGAEAHTVDLYGDGLMSVDITKQVTRAPDGKAVLVTNSGTIAADGGTIELTAKAADGIVTNLVSNTGRLRANSVGDKTGTISIAAIGGSINIEGAVQADGHAPGSAGGTVVLNATNAVALGATARISANGHTAGGTIAIGTTAARARVQGGGVPANAARTVTVAAGAKVSADGKGTGSGGSIALLSTDQTTMAGALSARGGRLGGNGGNVEISGKQGVSITGTVDTLAPAGKTGLLTIDPDTLVIGSDQTTANPAAPTANGSNQPPTGAQTISATTFNGFSTDVSLTAGTSITLQGTTALTSAHNVTLTGTGTGATVTVNVGLTATGTLTLIGGAGTGGAVAINSAISGGTVVLSGKTVSIGAAVASTVATGKSVAISADTLTLSGGASIAAAGGTVAVAPRNGAQLTVETTKGTTAGLSLTQADLNILAPSAGSPATLVLGDTSASPSGATATATTINFNRATTINAGTLAIYSSGDVNQTAGLTVTTLTGDTNGNQNLSSTANAITNLGLDSSHSSLIKLVDNVPLTVTGAVTGNGVALSAGTMTIAATGSVATSGTGQTIALNADSLTLATGSAVTASGGTVAVAPVTAGTAITVETTKGTTPGLSLTQADLNILAQTGASAPAQLTLGDTSASPSGTTATAGSIAFNRATTINAATLGLYSSGAVTQTGALTATTLTGDTVGLTLATAGNAITNLAAYTTHASALSLIDTGTLNITGAVTGAGVALSAPKMTTSATGSIATVATGQTIALNANSLTLNSASTVTASGGTVAVAPVTAGTAITVETSKGATPGLSLTQADLNILAQTGASAPATLVLGDTSATPSSGMAQAGSISLNTPTQLTINAGTLGLYATGAVTQQALIPAGTLSVGTLSGGAGSVSLTLANAVTNLGPFASGGLFSFTDGQALSVLGAVGGSAATVMLNVTGALTLGAAAVGPTPAVQGTLTGSTVSLTTTGALSEAAGSNSSITATTLTGSIGGTTTLTQANNAVANFGTFSSTGALSFTDSTGLNILGTLSAGTATGPLYSATSAGLAALTLNVTGNLTLGSAAPVQGIIAGSTVALNASGALTEAAGSASAVIATSLTGTAGNVALTTATSGGLGQQGNQIATLGSFSATGGDLAVVNSRNLSIAGPVSSTGGNTTITAQSGAGTPSVLEGTSAGALSITAAGSVAGTATTLTAYGALTDATGATLGATGTLSLNAGSQVAVTGITAGTVSGNAGTSFAASGAFDTASNIQAIGSTLNLTDTRATGLTLSGTSAANGAVTIAAPILTIAGNLSSSAAIGLQVPGAVTQTSGTIASSTTVTLAGTGGTGSATSIGMSGGLIAGQTSVALSVSGNATQTGGEVAGGTVQITSTGGSVDFGAARAPTVTFTAGSVTTTGAVLPSFTPGSAAVAFGAAVPTSVRIDAATISVDNALAGTTVELHSTGSTTQTTGTITAGTLTGTAGYTRSGTGPYTYDTPLLAAGSATLTGSNSIATIGPYYASGDLLIATAGSSTVSGKLVAGDGHRVGVTTGPNAADTLTTAANSLIGTGSVAGGAFAAAPGAGTYTAGTSTASRIELAANGFSVGAGTSFSVPGGTVAIAPSSARDLVIDTAAHSGSLVLSPTFFTQLATQTGSAGGTLVLGNTAAAPTAGTATATNIIFDQSVDLTTKAATLGLYTTGSVSQAAGTALLVGNKTAGYAGTLTGAASGSITLANAGTSSAPLNSFDVLNNLSAGTGMTIAEIATANAGQSGLSVTGAVSSTGGALSLTSLGAVVGGTRVGGTVAIGTAATAGVLDGTGQTVTLTAQDGAASASSITETAGSTIKAGTLAGRASTADTTATTYNVVLNNSTTNQIGTLGQFLVGAGGPAPSLLSAQGAFSLANAGALTVAGQVGAKTIAITANSMTVTGDVGTCIVGGAGGTTSLTATIGQLALNGGNVGGQTSVALSGNTGVVLGGSTVDAPLVTAAGGLTLNAGLLFGTTVTVTGGTTVGGGSLRATTLNAGTVAGLAAGTVQFSSGDIYTGGNLVVATPGTTIAGTLASTGTLTISSAGALSSSASATAAGTLSISSTGNFTQTAGTLGSTGTVAVTANGGLVSQTGGSIEAGSGAAGSGTITLTSTGSGGAAATLGGTLSAGQVNIIQPGYSTTVAPAALDGAATVGVGTLSLTFHCPGCDVATPAATGTVTATLGSGRPAGLRVDGLTLTLGTIAADTIELHSIGNTTNVGAVSTGTITANTLRGTAGYSQSGTDVNGLPTYAALASTGSLTLATPTAGSNSIASLGSYYAGGSISVAAGGTMTVVDKVVAGPNQTITLQAPTLVVNGNTASGLLTFGSVTGGAFTTAARTANAGTVAATTNASGSTVDLVTDALTLSGATPVVNARGGLVAIAPLTAGTALTIAADHSTTPFIAAPDLALINALGTGVDTGGVQTLRIGSLDGTAGPSASLALNSVLNLANVAATLGLDSGGSITEAPTGGITIGKAGVTGSITGVSGGTVTLTGAAAGTAPASITPTNHFDVLAGFTAASGLSVADSTVAGAGLSGLAVTGTVSSGTGSLGLLSVGGVPAATRVGGTIAIGTATLDATGQTLTLTARAGAANTASITETAGSAIKAATLTGRASTVDTSASGYDVALNTAGASNQIGTLGQFIVGTGGPAPSLVTPQGAFQLTTAGALTINGQVSAKSVAITGAGLTVAGDVGAGIAGGAGGTVALGSTGALTINSGTVGGQTSVALNSATGVALTGGTVDAAGGTSPAISVTGGLTQTGGSLFAGTVTITGGDSLNGGTQHATTLTAGTVGYTTGDLYAGNDLVIAAAPTITGSVATAGNLTVGFATGTSVNNATLLAQSNLGLTAPGDVTNGGTLAAGGNVNLAAGYTVAAGTYTSTGTGVITNTGTIEATGTVLLRASDNNAVPRASSIAGTLAGAAVQVVEPGAAVTLAPAALSGAATVTVGALTNAFHAPGFDGTSSSSTYSPVTSQGANRTPSLRADGNSLVLGTMSADAIELHSVGATTQTGALTAQTLTGTAGYIGVVTDPAAGLAATLPVYAPGTAQTRTAGGYTIAAPINGATVTLNNAANNILAINGYQVAGDAASGAGLTIVDQPANQTSSAGAAVTATGLTLTGIVRAGPATDPLDATAEAASGAAVSITTTGAQGALAVNGTLAGNSVTLANAGAISETGGIVVASTLTGSAPSVALNGANQVATLGTFTAGSGNFGFTNSRNLAVSGEVSAPAGSVAITAQSGTGTTSVAEGQSTGDLTILQPANGVAATVSGLTAALSGVDVAISGLVGTCSVAAGNTGTVVTATGAAGTINVYSGAVVGSETVVSLNAPGGVTVSNLTPGGATGTVGTVNAPTVTIGTGATINGGQVFGGTVTLNGASSMSAGLLHANTLNTPNGFTYTGGDLYSGNGLTLTSSAYIAGQSNLSGTVTTGGTLTITGGTISSSATLYAGADIVINSTGDVTQTSGLFAAANNVTVTATGIVGQSAAGQMEAGNTILLSASGNTGASVLGQLAGGTIQVIEPNAALTFAPAVFNAGDTHPLRGAATVTPGGLTNVYDCPGCSPANTPSSVVSASAAAPGTNRPGNLRADGASLTLGTSSPAYTLVIAADTVELHSAAATTQAGGSLEASSLSGTAGYAGSAATLPVYTLAPAQTRAADGSFTAAAAATGGTATLDSAGNNIAVLTSYQARGDDSTRAGFTLVDAPANQVDSAGVGIAPSGLLITGTVQAGPSSNPLDGSAAAASGNNVTITVNGGQGLQIGNAANPGALVNGGVVTLNSTGATTEGTGAAATIGSIVAGTLTGTSTGSILLATATTGSAGQVGNQIATLGPLTSTTGAIQLQDSRSLVVSGAVTAPGTVSITAQSGAGTTSVNEGQSAGNISVSAAIASTGSSLNLTAYGALAGSGISAPGIVSLNAGQGVNVAGVAAGTLTGNAGQSFAASGAFGSANSISAVAGGLTLADSAGVTLSGQSRSQADAAISAAGIVSNGLLASAGNVTLDVTAGSFVQTSGTIAAGGNLIIAGSGATVPMSGAIVQQAGLLAAGGTVRLLATGDAVQSAGATVAAPIVQVVSFAGNDSFGASQSASVVLPAASVNLAGVLPSFTVPVATVTLAGRPGAVLLDGNTVTVGSAIAADTVELHATGNLTELTGGTIQAGVLTGSTGFAAIGVDGAGLPIYAPLSGAKTGAGSATLAGGNNIQRLGNFYAGGGLILADTVAAQTTASGALSSTAGLTIGGTVRAGVATDPVTGVAADASGAPVTITLNGTNSTLSIGDAASPGAVLAGNVVTLQTPGPITEAAGAVTAAGTFTGSAATVSATPGAGNQILRLGAFNTTGNFSLLNASDLTVTGAVVAGPAVPSGSTPTLSLSTFGNLTLNGGSLAAGTIILTEGGAVTETNGSITATVLSGSASQLTANAAANAVGTLGFSAAGGISFTDGVSLTTGSLTSSAGPVSVTVNGNLVTQGAITAAGPTSLSATGTLTGLAGSTITGATVTGTSGGLTTLSGAVSTGGPVLFNANGLTLSGTIISGALTLNAGTGALTAAAGSGINAAQVTTTSGGGTTLSGGISSAGSAQISANGLALNGSLNTGALTFNAGGGALTAAAASTINASSLTSTSGGDTTLAGTIVAGPVTLIATNGGIVQSGSLTSSGTLTATAAGAATLSGNETASGAISVTAAGLTSSGVLNSRSGSIVLDAGPGALSLSGTVQAPGSITTRSGQGTTQTGTLASTSVNLSAGSTLSFNPASIVTAVSTLTETAGSVASFGGSQTAGGAISVVANGIGITGSLVSQGSSIGLNAGGGTLTDSGTLLAATTVTAKAAQPLTLSGQTVAGVSIALTSATVATLQGGAETAPLLTVTAPSIILSGNTIAVGGVPQPTGTKAESLPVVKGATVGAFFEAGSSFQQTGTTVRALSSQNATVRIDLTSGSGTLSLDRLSAPTTNLILDLNQGKGTGQDIQVQNLFVIYTGQGFGGGSLDLNSVTVGTQVGTGAAAASSVSPQSDKSYRINACAVASVNCVVIQPQAVPVGNPLKELSLSFFDDQDDARDLLVPNISDQGL